MNVMLAALQYGDSGYPAGGYAHSFGLETAVDEGRVADAASLDRALRALLSHQVGRTDAVAAAACARAAGARDVDTFVNVDRRLSATRPVREARDASWRVGRQMLRTAVECEDDAWLRRSLDIVQAGDADGNQAAVAGAVLGRAGAVLGRAGALPVDAASLALWSACTNMMNAAVRLGAITHAEAQRLFTGLRPLSAELAREAAAADWREMAGSMPRFEVWQMRHEVARTRLFAS